jgi:hypothetical protein
MRWFFLILVLGVAGCNDHSPTDHPRDILFDSQPAIPDNFTDTIL